MSSQFLASVSDTLFSATIAIYSVALIGYCAELAFSRGGGLALRARAGVAAPGRDLPSDSGSPGEGAPGEPGDHGVGVAGRAAVLGRIAVALTALAATVQAGVLLTRGLATQRLPWGNVYEFGTAVVLVAVVAFLAVLRRTPGSRRLGLFVVGPATLALVLIGLFLYTQAGPLVAALRSAWLAVHVTAAMLGFGTFMVSGIASVLYLVRVHREGRESPGADAAERSSRLPSAATLDAVAHRTAVVGFPIWNFAVIAGAIWAESAWGRFWG